MLMDANGTRYHTLLSRDDWKPLIGDTLEWDPAASEVTLRRTQFRFQAPPADVKPAPRSRRGAAADRFGNLYWIDEDRRRIRVRSSGDGAVSDFWPAKDEHAPASHGDFSEKPSPAAVPLELSGLAVTEDHYLVAGTTSPPGLLVFDLYATGAPTHSLWPVRFEPLDMAARPGGGVWILDRRSRYWGLDRYFRVIVREQGSDVVEPVRDESFQPADTDEHRIAPEKRFPTGISYDASPVEALDAVAIEGLPDGSVLILDRGKDGSRVLRYRFAQRLAEAPLADADGANLRAHDFVRLAAAEGKGERLIVASAEGNQAFEFALAYEQDKLKLEPVRSYWPMRRFAGKGLLVVGSLPHYDFSDTWVPLVCHGRARFIAAARAETRAAGFDGGEPDCVWHRLTLDAIIPPETAVRVESRAANSRDALPGQRWQTEPAPYRRSDGAEVPWLLRQRYDTYELLFQRARGRFLQLRLTLSGNERASPRLRALRAWYPRFSYSKNYLPAVYREEADSADFLERFLANFEGLYTALEDKVAHVRALFHWGSAPAEALAWLAGWFGAVLDPAWDERRQRLFIKHAVHFFQFRGTLHGLRMALALALDRHVCDDAFDAPGKVPESRQRYRIVERFRTRRTPGLALGEPLRDAGPREVQPQPRWLPAEGGSQLTERLRTFLKARGDANWQSAEFTLVPPVDASFAQQVLGFVPSSAAERAAWQRFLAAEYGNDTARLKADFGTTDVGKVRLPIDMPAATQLERWTAFIGLRGAGQERRQWQEFLARRYRVISALNAAYGTKWKGFELVPLFDRPPPDGAPLADWYQFESVVKAMHRHAHRFSVLIPSRPNADRAELLERLALARRVVEAEKPAHTIFDVGFYWALFRVGEARLGFDTLIDVGSRALDLLPELVLGRHYIGSSQLARPIVRPEDRRLSIRARRSRRWDSSYAFLRRSAPTSTTG
jgi:phage tail-like protein